MIFWALIVLAGLATVGAFVYFTFIDDLMGGLEGALFGVLTAIITALFSSVLGGLILMGLSFIPASHVRPHHYALASLGTQQGVTGEFYLGSGFINGARELSYVKQDGDHYVATEADGASSDIYQGAGKPSVTEYEWYWSNPWIAPWTYDTGWSYDFHVPKGTILNDYRVG